MSVMDDIPGLQPRGRLVLATGMLYASHVACMPLLPLKAADAAWSELMIGVLVASYVAAAILARLASPVLLPRLETRTWLRLSAALLCGSCLVYATVAPGAVYFLARAVQGVAFGIFTTAAYSFVAVTTKQEERGRALATVGAAMSAALVLAPPLALWFDQRADDLGFWFAAILALLAMPVAAGGTIALPEAREGRGHLDRLAVTCLFGIGLAGAAIGIVEAFGPLIIVRRELGSIALLFALFGMAMVAGRIAGGWLSDRWDRNWTAVLASAALGASMISYPQVWTETLALIVTAAIGFCAGLCLSALSALISSLSRADHQVKAMAGATLAADIGLVAGALLAGFQFWDGQPGWGSAALTTGFLCSCVAIAFALWGGEARRPIDEAVS